MLDCGRGLMQPRIVLLGVCCGFPLKDVSTAWVCRGGDGREGELIKLFTRTGMRVGEKWW